MRKMMMVAGLLVIPVVALAAWITHPVSKGGELHGIEVHFTKLEGGNLRIHVTAPIVVDYGGGKPKGEDKLDEMLVSIGDAKELIFAGSLRMQELQTGKYTAHFEISRKHVQHCHVIVAYGNLQFTRYDVDIGSFFEED